MPSFLKELADLAEYLVVVCVPIAVAALSIPVGRALGDRIRRGTHSSPELSAWDERSADLSKRLDALEQAIDAAALEVERLGEQQRYLAKGQTIQARSVQRVITPH